MDIQTINEKIANNPNRMVLIPEIMEMYKVPTLNVRVRSSEPNDYITIYPKMSMITQLKIKMLYNPHTNKLTISQNLIGVQNYWITQLLDDLKNNRIQMDSYTI